MHKICAKHSWTAWQNLHPVWAAALTCTHDCEAKKVAEVLVKDICQRHGCFASTGLIPIIRNFTQCSETDILADPHRPEEYGVTEYGRFCNHKESLVDAGMAVEWRSNKFNRSMSCFVRNSSWRSNLLCPWLEDGRFLVAGRSCPSWKHTFLRIGL